MPADVPILGGTSQIACPSGGAVAVLQHVMHQSSDLVAGNGGAVAQWTLHRLLLQMIQGRVHEDAGLQQLLLHFGKTHASFFVEGRAARGFRFANQTLCMQVSTQRLQLLGGRRRGDCDWGLVKRKGFHRRG